MTENQLYERVAQYIALRHPEVKGLFHFDLAGVWTPSHKARNLYGRLNRRAWPDLFLPHAVMQPHTINVYYGLFLELKRDGTRLHKKDGSWASPHIKEQAEVLYALQEAGYVAQFAVGFDQAVELIDSYLEGSLDQLTHDLPMQPEDGEAF